jgi:putative SOS response-associated peptidase YedK
MCGRIAQHRYRKDYAEGLGWDVSDQRKWNGGDSTAFYNLPPGLCPTMIYLDDKGGQHIHGVRWGYRPEWAKEKGLPIAINATIEKAEKPYWRSLWKTGRAIIPADGWFEWTGDKGQKLPWYIRLKTDRPMYMAALSNMVPYAWEPPESDKSGFAIITSEATGGLLDVHDRRPVVLSPEDAMIWLDRGIKAEQAYELARSTALPPEAFEWYRVSADVNKTGVNEKRLIAPIG